MAKKPSKTRAILKRALLPAAALSVMAFFGVNAIFGANGLLAFGDYKRQLAKREQEYAMIEAKRAMLQNRVVLLDPRHANPDLVDELVRKKLNVAHPDEMIVPMN